MIRGAPTSNTKTKEYEYVFDDSDVALEPGADTPVKCKRKTKNEKN